MNKIRKPREPWSPEDDARLRDLWHSDIKMDGMADLFPGRSAGAIYDHGKKILKLGQRRVQQTFQQTFNWKQIVALLEKGPKTAMEIAETVGLSHTYTLDLLRKSHGRCLIHVYAWTSQFAKGGPARIWALGQGVNARKPRPLTRKQIVKRYRVRMMKDCPEQIDIWRNRQKIREREKRGLLTRPDAATVWLKVPPKHDAEPVRPEHYRDTRAAPQAGMVGWTR